MIETYKNILLYVVEKRSVGKKMDGVRKQYKQDKQYKLVKSKNTTSKSRGRIR